MPESAPTSAAVRLTGDRPTTELPRLTGKEPVTVTVARKVRPGCEGRFLAWCDDVLAQAREYPGFLGGGVLAPGPAGGEHQIIVRFADAVLLRHWERSTERAALLAEAAPLVEASRAAVVIGTDAFFDAADVAEPEPQLPVAVAADVAWVFPVAVAASLLVAPLLLELPMLLRTLLTTAAITVVMRLAVAPVRGLLRRRRSIL